MVRVLLSWVCAGAIAALLAGTVAAAIEGFFDPRAEGALLKYLSGGALVGLGAAATYLLFGVPILTVALAIWAALARGFPLLEGSPAGAALSLAAYASLLCALGWLVGSAEPEPTRFMTLLFFTALVGPRLFASRFGAGAFAA